MKSKFAFAVLISALTMPAALAQGSFEQQKRDFIADRQAKLSSAIKGSPQADNLQKAIQCFEAAKNSADINKCLADEKERAGDLLSK